MSGGWHALIGALSLIALATIGGSLMAAGLATGAARVRMSAERQAGILLLSLCLPVLLAGLFIAAGFIPSLLHAASLVFDDCALEYSHHPHLCMLHPSLAFEGPALWLSIVGALWLSVALVRMAVQLPQLRPARIDPRLELFFEDLPEEQQDALIRATAGFALPVQVIRSPLPFAALTGLLRPKVLLSTTLLEMLNPDELHAVLLHEAAHDARHDLWIEALTGMLSAFHLPRLGQRLVAAFQAAAEEACDEHGAKQLGTGLPGASALLRLQRWSLKARRSLERPVERLAVGFIGRSCPHAVEHRIQRLLSWSAVSEADVPVTRPIRSTVVLFATLLLIFLTPIHAGVEHLLAILCH